MKKLIVLAILLGFMQLESRAQESFGNTLNLGLGVGGYSGYYGYIGQSLPVLSLNYEFDVAPNFTLAPFASFYTYSNRYYWGNNNTPSRYYKYRETVIPLGVKGTYYFDQLFNATPAWDFYAAGSLGFAIVKSRWDDGYQGDTNIYKGGSSLFLDVHLGLEYHINKKVGVFLDLSSGVSTLGLAIH
ncbi:hypothetical protein RT717_13950 [Imperialibacter roseus]|uniref:Outer membrane protein beta-barrel domain-containing protein n=1 Tax=Imperialibacter roseus TaxID=1324217 RepID=A0ABZ0II71_9BACT|nr:hypothetical protein [Imperialibacter roseus]WOK04178.1 hypothetical protein RT717_13950 [Imperialibacter roseus]